MKTADFLYLALLQRTLDYQKDPNPKNWVTINGARVHLDNNGNVDGGAGGKLNGKKVFSSKEKASESAAESYKEIEIPAMTANPFKEREKGRAQAEERRKAWESVLTDKNLIAAEWTFPNGNKNVLSRSVKSDGWQLSWFNKEGEPFGDTQGESPMELYNRNPGDFTTKSGLKVSAVFSEERSYG